MTTAHKWTLIGVMVLSIALLVVGKLWLDAHDARLKAEAQNAPLQKTVQDQAKVISDAQAQMKQNQAILDAQLAAIAKERTIVVTPQAAVQALPQIVPNLPVQPTVQATPTPANPQAQSIVIPQEDLPSFQNYVLDCKEKDAKLSACSLNQAAMQTEIDAKNKQIEAETQEAENWKKAAKGTFWGKLGHLGKCLGGSAILAGAGAVMDSKHPAQGAMIGAAAGTTVCEVTRW